MPMGNQLVPHNFEEWMRWIERRITNEERRPQLGSDEDSGGFTPDTPGGGNVVTGSQTANSQVSVTSTTEGSGSSTTDGTDSIAIGWETNAIGWKSIAIGSAAYASDSEAIAIGNVANATAADSISMGPSDATARAAIAIGVAAQGLGIHSVAIGGTTDTGHRVTASGANAVAVGMDAQATAAGAVALGCDSNDVGASATATDEFVLGTPLHHVKVPGLFNLPPEAGTPGTPVDGDVWVTSAGMYARVNGATRQLDLAGGSTITPGAGLTQTGSSLDVVPGDSSLVVNADELHVNTAVIATVASVTAAVTGMVKKYASALAGSVAYATGEVFTHNLNTRDIQVSVVNNASPWNVIQVDWEATSVNTVTVRYNSSVINPTGYRLVVMG